MTRSAAIRGFAAHASTVRRRRRFRRTAPTMIATTATMIGISAISRNSSPCFSCWILLRKAALHIAQLAPGLQHFGAELLDRLGLLGRQGRRAVGLVFAGQVGELGLGAFEILLQRLLLGAVARLRLALDPVDDLERPGRGAAAAQPDQILAAGEHVDRIGDKIAIVGERHGDLLAKEILALHPDPVVEHIGVGDDDDVDRMRRLFEPGRRRRAGSPPVSLRGLGLGRLAASAGAGGFGGPSGKALSTMPVTWAARM